MTVNGAKPDTQDCAVVVGEEDDDGANYYYSMINLRKLSYLIICQMGFLAKNRVL